MKKCRDVLMVLLLTIVGLTLFACSKSDDDKGTMEKAGQAVDQALDKAKDKTGQAMEKAGEAMKETGEKMREGSQK